jgi:hypothetical protein
VEIADPETCLMMTQSVAEGLAPPAAEAIADAAELTSDAAADAAEDATDAADDAADEAELEALEPQAASTAQHPAAKITVTPVLVTLNTSISFRPLPGASAGRRGGHIGVPTALVRSLLDGSPGNGSRRTTLRSR